MSDSTLQDSYDIAIIGAGPAGMSAAITASTAGASVVVIDDKARPGGQIYRNVGNSPLHNSDLLGADYLQGRSLIDSFNNCPAEKLSAANVWHLGENGEVLFSQNQQTRSLSAREVIVTVGAMERPFPINGWHLPGVMSAGSAQVMLKSDGLVCDDAVFVGTGPLLYLIVAQYLRLGVRVRALVDTTPVSNYIQSIRYLPGALAHARMLAKGLGLLNEIRRSGTAVYRFAREVKIVGEGRASGVCFQAKGQTHQLDSNHIFLHQGVIPNLNMTRSLGLKHRWCSQQLCWKPTINNWGQSSIDSIAVAGDGGGIVGAEGAELSGKLAALNQLHRLGRIDKRQRDSQAAPSQHRLQHLNRFRQYIDRLYSPQDQQRLPQQDDTVVCRCEEQNLGQLRAGFDQGARGPNELKSLTRCGMGPCQGRQCGHTVSELLAQWRDEPVEAVGYYRLRSPMRLLNLTELSQFSRVQPKPDLEFNSSSTADSDSDIKSIKGAAQ
ncbi:MAG: FAD-dependent oxidoreductase [Motiliproteus sp.]